MKKCPNCGTELGSDYVFCKKCGSPINKELKGNTDETEILSFEDDKKEEKTVETLYVYPALTEQESNSNNNTFQEIPTTPVTVPAIQPVVEESFQESVPEDKDSDDSKKTRTIISIVCGILSILLFGIPVPAIIGLLLAITVDRNYRLRKTALIINIVALIIDVTVTFIFACFILSVRDDSLDLDREFVGNGYSISFGENWEKATLPPNNIDVLKYTSSTKSYIAEIDHSSYEEVIKCNINEESCQEDVYNDFYEYWKNDIAGYYDFEKDIGFNKLKDDIYIAKYTYRLKTTGVASGKYYLLISKSKNAILSFVARVDDMKIKYFDSEATLLFNSIEIDKVKPLDKINNWNDYSYLRGDVAAKNMNINGEYRILSDDESYWVFNDEEFWFFKSEDRRNDNYWYGKYTFKTGKKGLTSLGITNEQIKEFASSLKKNQDIEDVYSLVLKPEMLVSDGYDKSTDIPDNTEWKLVWLLINHKKDGIEAQVLNVDNYEYSYYFKVKD